MKQRQSVLALDTLFGAPGANPDLRTAGLQRTHVPKYGLAFDDENDVPPPPAGPYLAHLQTLVWNDNQLRKTPRALATAPRLTRVELMLARPTKVRQ